MVLYLNFDLFVFRIFIFSFVLLLFDGNIFEMCLNLYFKGVVLGVDKGKIEIL